MGSSSSKPSSSPKTFGSSSNNSRKTKASSGVKHDGLKADAKFAYDKTFTKGGPTKRYAEDKDEEGSGRGRILIWSEKSGS
jgi:hypothetical protein